jgi:predicted dehydrogenase
MSGPSVAVVGTGFGCFTHVRALRNAGFEVVALVGRDAEKTKTRAKLFDVPIASTSLDDALGLGRLDAVTIATPPNTHAALVLSTIAAGKHVLCEKPLARDARQAETMRAAAERAGVVHLLGTEFRFDTGQALLARAVHDGLVGEPKLALFVLHVPMLAEASSDVPQWWTDASEGGGWLTAHGSQVIDQIRVTVGEIARVTASAVPVADRTPTWGADDGFLVHLVARNGAAVVMQSTPSDRGPLLIDTRVVGSHATAWIEGLGATVKIADASGTRTLAVPDELVVGAPEAPPREALQTTYEQMTGHGLDLGPYTRLAEHFRARIEGTAPPPGPSPATFADGVADMAVLDACRQSAATETTVDVAG